MLLTVISPERLMQFSGIAQIGLLIVGLIGGRVVAKTRSSVWVWAGGAAALAMMANLLADGQGAFLMLVYAPIIYFISIVGRDELA